MTTQTTSTTIAAALRYSARIITLVWAGWWTFFGLASGIGEGAGILGILEHTTLPGLIFLVTAFTAWRWERAGGTALVVMGLLVCIGYPLTTSGQMPSSVVTSVVLTMVMPPLAAGGLFNICGRISRSAA
jgi:hypothetical protein